MEKKVYIRVESRSIPENFTFAGTLPVRSMPDLVKKLRESGNPVDLESLQTTNGKLYTPDGKERVIIEVYDNNGTSQPATDLDTLKDLLAERTAA